MQKTILLLATAILMTGSALATPALARDRSERSDNMTANQLVNLADAQTARMKVDLRLTPEQEKDWPGFESAMRDMGKKRADRRIAMRDERSKQNDPVDFLEQINRRADSRIERSNDWKKLTDAAKPLYASLDESQKRRFAESLLGGDRERDTE